MVALLWIPVEAGAQPAAPAPAAPAAPAPAAAPAGPAAPAPAPGAPAPPSDAPPGYYVEPPQPGAPPPPHAGQPPPGQGGTIYEPPPPGFYPPGEPVYEPPPPPEPRHLAPKTSLWLGARAGWFIPFGNAWAETIAVDNYGGAVLRGVPWSRYASSGPMFELDLGARLSRSYTVFGLWERAQLGAGSRELEPDASSSSPKGGDTDYFAVGLRANTDPDRVGFITELALGYRRARSTWADGGELQFTEAPFEARIGLGAEIRLSRQVSLDPLFTLGVGAFGNVRFVKNGTTRSVFSPTDTSDGHAWATFVLGGHFDLLGSK